jgi:hypothetical protein
VIVLVLVAACGGDDNPLIDIAIVTPAGDTPLEGFETIGVTVRQGEGEAIVSEGTVSADGFDVRVTIDDFVNPVDLAVTLSGPAGTVVGGAPSFVPGETGRSGDVAGLVVVAVGPPRTCAVLSELSLEDRRRALGLSRQGTFAAALGGIDASGPSDVASYLDLLRLGFEDEMDPTTTRLPPFPTPLGATRAYGFSNSRALVLSELEDPFVFDITGRCDAEGEVDCYQRLVPAGLHGGAASTSGALVLSNGGVVVVGGTDRDGSRSDEVTWLDAEGVGSRTYLSTARESPRLVELEGGAVLVVGGELGGAYAEVIRREDIDGSPIADPRVDGIVRVGGMLHADPTGRSALLVGGETPDERLLPETELFTGCPGACRIEAGPTWDGARYAPTQVQRARAGGLIIGGGDPPVATIDTMVWDDPTRVRFETHGDLAVGRRGAAALALANGVVFVAGGTDDSGPRLDVEVCFPDSVELP